MLIRLGYQLYQLHDKLKSGKDRIFRPLVNILPQWLSPNHITFFRFVITLIWLPFALIRPSFAQIIIFFIVYFLDLLDGALARFKNQITYFGKHFDLFSDQINHIAFFVTLFSLTNYQLITLKFFIGWEMLTALFVVIAYFLKNSKLDYIRTVSQFCVRISLCLILIYEVVRIYS